MRKVLGFFLPFRSLCRVCGASGLFPILTNPKPQPEKRLAAPKTPRPVEKMRRYVPVAKSITCKNQGGTYNMYPSPVPKYPPPPLHPLPPSPQPHPPPPTSSPPHILSTTPLFPHRSPHFPPQPLPSQLRVRTSLACSAGRPSSSRAAQCQESTVAQSSQLSTSWKAAEASRPQRVGRKGGGRGRGGGQGVGGAGGLGVQGWGVVGWGWRRVGLAMWAGKQRA